MVFASNGLNTWAIHYIPTNQSALLNGTAAFWIAGLGVFGRRGHPLTRWAVLGMGIGFAGAALMLIPKGGMHSIEPAGAIRCAHRLLRLGARHAVLPQYRHRA